MTQSRLTNLTMSVESEYLAVFSQLHGHYSHAMPCMPKGMQGIAMKLCDLWASQFTRPKVYIRPNTGLGLSTGLLILVLNVLALSYLN